MKTRRKRVSIISRESDSRTLDIAMLEDELIKCGCEVRVLSKLLTKDKSLKALGYAGHVLKGCRILYLGEVIIQELLGMNIHRHLNELGINHIYEKE